MALLVKTELEAARASSADPITQQEVDICSTSIGASDPLGATVHPSGVNFSLFSRKASRVELMLFDREDQARPTHVINIDPTTNRTYHYWHVFVPNLQPGQIYGYRIDGPVDPANGLRFDPAKVLLDPYGRSVVVPRNYNREAACEAGDNTATAMKSVVVDPSTYDWEGNAPLKVHRHGPSSTRCTCAVSRVTPAPASHRRSGARIGV